MQANFPAATRHASKLAAGDRCIMCKRCTLVMLSHDMNGIAAQSDPIRDGHADLVHGGWDKDAPPWMTVPLRCFVAATPFICTYAPPFQAGASELALNLPGKVMHMRALCSGLASIRESLLYVKNALEDHDMDWTIVQDTVARELTMASMFLGGVLDGCVIAVLPSRDNGFPPAPTRFVSFQGTTFKDAKLRDIQAEVNGLRSFAFEEQSVQASLWTVINFWKHYFPYQLLPTEFSRGRLHTLRDFQLVLGGDPGIPESKDSLNSKPLSGPVVHDLLIPAFNAACGITARLVEIYAVSGNHSVAPIDM
eukprot:gene27577-biopygen5012